VPFLFRFDVACVPGCLYKKHHMPISWNAKGCLIRVVNLVVPPLQCREKRNFLTSLFMEKSTSVKYVLGMGLSTYGQIKEKNRQVQFMRRFGSIMCLLFTLMSGFTKRSPLIREKKKQVLHYLLYTMHHYY
jgi:hypothetical protein